MERFHIELETCSQSQQGCHFLSTVRCLGPAVCSIHWGQWKRETMQVSEAEPGASSESKAERGFTDCWACLGDMRNTVRRAYVWRRWEVMWVWVRIQRGGEREGLQRSTSWTAAFGGEGERCWGNCRNQKVSMAWQIWANTSSGDLSASTCRRRHAGGDEVFQKASQSLMFSPLQVHSGLVTLAVALRHAHTHTHTHTRTHARTHLTWHLNVPTAHIKALVQPWTEVLWLSCQQRLQWQDQRHQTQSTLPCAHTRAFCSQRFHHNHLCCRGDWHI